MGPPIHSGRSSAAASFEAFPISTPRHTGGGPPATSAISMDTALAAAKLGAAEQLAQALDAKAEAANARDAEGALAARWARCAAAAGRAGGARVCAASVTRFFCDMRAGRAARTLQAPGSLRLV